MLVAEELIFNRKSKLGKKTRFDKKKSQRPVGFVLPEIQLQAITTIFCAMSEQNEGEGWKI